MTSDPNDSHRGWIPPEEEECNPLTDDQVLLKNLRDEARALGMLFSVDKAVVRAALVAALPQAQRTRAIALLGDDPMYARDPSADDAYLRQSAVECVLHGVIDLMDEVTARANRPASDDAGYNATDLAVLEGLGSAVRRPDHAFVPEDCSPNDSGDEAFNYLIAYSEDGSSALNAYSYHGELQYGTRLDAESFLAEVKAEIPDHPWRIVRID